MIEQIKKDYKLIKNKGNFVERLSEKIKRSKDTIKVHYFGYWNIPIEMQPIIHEHILKELERQKTLDFTVDEMLEEIASYKNNSHEITDVKLIFSDNKWSLTIKFNFKTRGHIKSFVSNSPREACLDALEYIK